MSGYDQSYYGYGTWLRRFVSDAYEYGARYHFEAWVFGLRYISERHISIEKAKELVKKYGYLGSSKPSWVAEEDWGEKFDARNSST